jgi:hypothetical protein
VIEADLPETANRSVTVVRTRACMVKQPAQGQAHLHPQEATGLRRLDRAGRRAAPSCRASTGQFGLPRGFNQSWTGKAVIVVEAYKVAGDSREAEVEAIALPPLSLRMYSRGHRTAPHVRSSSEGVVDHHGLTRTTVCPIRFEASESISRD